MDTSLLDFLQSEYVCGRFDSHGVFSLDMQQAKAKLARFQLAHPYGFLLCWVRHAVCQDASRIQISEHGSRLTFQHDGASPAADQLESMYFSDSAAQRELAIGILNACKPAGSCVELVGEQIWARFDRAGQEVRAGASPGVMGCTITRILKRSWFSRLTWWWPRDKPALELLSGVARLAPLSLWAGGKELTRPLSPKVCLRAGLFRTRYGGRATQIPHDLAKPAQCQDIDDDFSVLFLLGLQDEEHGLLLIMNGVSHRLALPWPLPHTTVVVAAPHLRLDLSGSTPLQDERFSTVMGRCRHYLAEFLQGMEQDPKTEGARKQLSFPYLQVLVTLYAGAQQFDRAFTLCQRLRSWIDLAVAINDASLGIFLYRYFLVARAVGNHGLADPLRSLALTAWAKVDAKHLTEAAQVHHLLPEALTQRPAEHEHLLQLLRFSLEEQMLGAAAPGLADALTQLANKAEGSGDFEIAQFCYAKLVRLEQEPIALVHRHVRLGNVLSRRARLMNKPEMWLKARESYRLALALIPDDYDSEREERSQVRVLAQVLEGLASVEAALGRLPEARQLLERSLAFLGTEGGDALARRDILVKLMTVLKASGEHKAVREAEAELNGLKLPQVT